MSYGMHFVESWLHERIAKLEAERDALAEQLIDARMAANDNPAPEKDVSDSDVDATTEKRSKTEHDGADSREKLEADVRKHYSHTTSTLMYPPSANKQTDWLAPMPMDTVFGWLDRQDTITYHEIVDRWAEHLHPIEQRSADLTVKVDELERAYHRACHERDELREILSRLLGLCDEMQRVASFYGQSVPYGAADGCDEGLA